MGTVYMFVYNDMADFEITYAAHLLKMNCSKEIIPISYDQNLVKSKSGIDYMPQKTVLEALNEEADGLIITGGWNGEIRDELVTLIQKMDQENKLLAAICAGPRFLAKSGALKDKKFTTSIINWTEELEKMFNESNPFPVENYVMNRVVRDANIITAQGYAFVDFAIEIADYFNLYENQDDKLQHLNFMCGKN